LIAVELIPPKYERYIGLVLIFLSTILFIALEKATFNIFFFAMPTFLVLLFFKAKRELKEIKSYKLKRFENTNFLTQQKRFIFSSFLAFKTTKPMLAYCLICVNLLGDAALGTNAVHKELWPNALNHL